MKNYTQNFMTDDSIKRWEHKQEARLLLETLKKLQPSEKANYIVLNDYAANRINRGTYHIVGESDSSDGRRMENHW